MLGLGKPVVLVLVNGGALSIEPLLPAHTNTNTDTTPSTDTDTTPNTTACTDGRHVVVGVDYRNQDNQTYTHADSRQACCLLCAARQDPPCSYYTFTGNRTMHDKDRSNCYMKVRFYWLSVTHRDNSLQTMNAKSIY